jgi:hypothetical protein
MTINYNSFSSKVYRWFYATDKMPNNLCPYFWKLIVAFVLAIPLFLFTLPFEIVQMFARIKQQEVEFVPIHVRLLGTVVILILLFGLAAFFAPISLFFGYEPQEKTFLSNLIVGGLLIWMIAFIAGMVSLIGYLKDRYDSNNGNRKRNKVKGDNIVVEFAKAKYNKYCPKIEWVNNKTEYEYDDF